MEFAADKCKVLTITLKTKRNTKIYNYDIHGHILERVDSANYLGVTLDSKLDFGKHIANICKKANNASQFLQRNLRSCNTTAKAATYTTCVRPILEYALCGTLINALSWESKETC